MNLLDLYLGSRMIAWDRMIFRGGDWFPPQDQQMPDEFIIFQGGPEDMPDMFAEMEEMFNNFFQGFGPNGGLTPPEFFSGPGIGGMISPPGDGHSGETESITQGESLRDRMLKHPQQGSGSHENQSPSPNKETEKPPGSGLPHSWFGDFWNLPFGGTSQPQDNIDKDFDSELEKGEQTLDDILKPGHRPKLQSPLRSFSSSSSITSFNSNGKSESKVTRRDSRGNEEVIITRQLGDRKHIIRHFVDETGSRQIEENFVNMNSDNFQEFEDSWNKGPTVQPFPPSLPGRGEGSSHSLYDSVLERFFPWRK
ncbi:uncharacterized protein LOC5503433 isoform X2 [Nematostella vectensis]|uniref:uncharacterized protein LOC5503433 isoform X2 n=1 Tax=Nematostella vectensis TaxID=45351 RepID=UPI00207717BD|nr:uncharacterized protein LOC5503433 isoform X2 [Nematostella vectensis]